MPAHSRKGQHEMQFNWIFALVGGALFLLFFFILIRSITNQHTDGTTREQRFAVETILTTAVANPDTFTVTQLPDATYRIVCANEADGIHSYVRIDTSPYDEYALQYVPLFSPATIKGDELFTATRTWDAPFPVGSIALVSNNRVRYVYVGSTAELSRIRMFIDEENLGGFNNVTIGAGAVNTIKDQGYDAYRFIYFTAPDFSKIDATVKKKATALVVFGASTDGYKSGKLQFYKSASTGLVADGGQIDFYGRAMLDAAIFSEKKIDFECNMLKAKGKLRTTLMILKSRIAPLKGSVTNSACATIYSSAEGEITSYIKTPPAPQTALTKAEVDSLEDYNQQLIGLDCPTIY